MLYNYEMKETVRSAIKHLFANIMSTDSANTTVSEQRLTFLFYLHRLQITCTIETGFSCEPREKNSFKSQLT